MNTTALLITLVLLLLALLLAAGLWFSASAKKARKPRLVPDRFLHPRRHKPVKDHHEPHRERPQLIELDFETAEEITPHEFPDLPVPGGFEVPWGYGDTTITVQVRDPYWIHIFWEIHGHVWEDISRHFGPEALQNSSTVLRVYDVTGVSFNGLNANSFYDVEIEDYSRNWYIRVPHPNRVYCIDLGRRFTDGRLAIIARSGYIYTPREGMSEKYDELWMLVGDGEKRLLDRLGGEQGLSSYYLLRQK